MTESTRRQVLGYSALLAGASIAAGPASAAQRDVRAVGQPMPRGVQLPSGAPQRRAADSVGIAIIGLGSYALNQIMPSVTRSKRCHIAAVVSGNPDKAKTVAGAYGVPSNAVYSYDAFDRIARDRRVDAVYIILPSGLHAEWAEKSFAAGKHVLCEKPMALSAAECERMIAASAAATRKLMIGYRCHFEPMNLKAMALMRERAVGATRVIRTDQHYVLGATTPAQNWRVNRALGGRGPLEDYGIYGLQSALYLTGEMPEAVTAQASRPASDPRFSEFFAHVASQLHFPSGAVAQLSSSYDAAHANRCEVRGDKGVLLMSPATNYTDNTLRVNDTVHPPEDSSVQFAAMLDHFAAAIRDGTPILTPGEMGLRDLRLMDAIYASAERGATVRLLPDGRMRS